MNGKRRRIVRTHDGNRKSAQAALAELLVEVGHGRGKGTNANLGDLLARWYEMIEATHSPWTLKGYRHRVDRMTKALGHIRLAKLDGSDIDGYYRNLIGHGLAPATVRQDHAILRKALGQAVKWGWLATNPAERATAPSVVRKQIRPPAVVDILRIIGLARERSPELAVWLHVAAVTGARRGEICGLRWTDIDTATGELVIRRSIVDADSKTLIEKDTKTHAERRIALDAGTLEALGVHRDEMAKRAVAVGETLRPDAFVFSDDYDGRRPWRPGRVTRAFTRLRERAGLPDVRTHDLRHAAATLMLSSGVDVRTVAGRLGHAQPSTTLNVYGHFVAAADRQAADLLGGALNGKQPAS